MTRQPTSRTGGGERAEPSGTPEERQGERAEETVLAYYDAINAGDYRRAWELGGKSLAGSYEAFTEGFADTVSDTVVITGVQGDTVSVELEALQTDGSLKHFTGTYTVRGGAIVDAAIQETGGTSPTAEGSWPYYEDCADVRDAEAAPLRSDEPGYSLDLDRDADGTACEPSPSGTAD